MTKKENADKELFPKNKDGWSEPSTVHYMETYHELENCVENSQAKSIGLCNFSLDQCQDVLKNCRIKPVCNQIEMHPYFQNRKLMEFCQNNGILVVGYSTPDAVDTNEVRDQVENMLDDYVLVAIGKKYGKTPAQVCLRWSLQLGCVPLVNEFESEKILQSAQVYIAH
jgi:diketogulonate reductase-like aldo/keto reductase